MKTEPPCGYEDHFYWIGEGFPCPKCKCIADRKRDENKRVKLALALSKLVHDECENVPHDIGLKLLDVFKEMQK